MCWLFVCQFWCFLDTFPIISFYCSLDDDEYKIKKLFTRLLNIDFWLLEQQRKKKCWIGYCCCCCCEKFQNLWIKTKNILNFLAMKSSSPSSFLFWFQKQQFFVQEKKAENKNENENQFPINIFIIVIVDEKSPVSNHHHVDHFYFNQFFIFIIIVINDIRLLIINIIMATLFNE